MKKSKVFESKINESVIGDNWRISSGTNAALSSFGFNLSDNMREAKFPQLENTGSKDMASAVEIVITGAEDNGKSVAKALNDSGLGYNNWKVKSDDGKKIEITSTDSSDNTYSIILTKR